MLIDLRNHREYLGAATKPFAPITKTFSGACVDRATLVAKAIAVGANTTLDFAAGAYDVGGWFNPGTPTVLTVPAGVTRVRDSVSCALFANFGINDVVLLRTALNGVVNLPAGQVTYSLGPNTLGNWARTSPPYSVTPGDTISVQIIATVLTPAVFLVFGTANSSLCVEAVS